MGRDTQDDTRDRSHRSRPDAIDASFTAIEWRERTRSRIDMLRCDGGAPRALSSRQRSANWLRHCAARENDRGSVSRIAPLALVLVLGILIGSPARAEDAPSATLTGAAALDRVAGNTLEGTTADGPYTLFFATDGHLVSTDRDGRVDGTWAFRDGKLCTALPDEDEECRALEVSGPAGAFVDGDGSRYPFTIAPGDPKGL